MSNLVSSFLEAGDSEKLVMKDRQIVENQVSNDMAGKGGVIESNKKKSYFRSI